MIPNEPVTPAAAGAAVEAAPMGAAAGACASAPPQATSEEAVRAMTVAMAERDVLFMRRFVVVSGPHPQERTSWPLSIQKATDRPVEAS